MPFGKVIISFGKAIMPFGKAIISFGKAIVRFGKVIMPFGKAIVRFFFGKWPSPRFLYTFQSNCSGRRD
jgi:hypothetical protein